MLGYLGMKINGLMGILPDIYMQKVKVNGILSGAAGLKCRVPQSSALGPLVFLYVNDIVDYVPARIHLFADDTVI